VCERERERAQDCEIARARQRGTERENAGVAQVRFTAAKFREVWVCVYVCVCVCMCVRVGEIEENRERESAGVFHSTAWCSLAAAQSHEVCVCAHMCVGVCVLMCECVWGGDVYVIRLHSNV